ncbi:hypothetical protein DACRYDRAFT_48637 [Dacryopinax primogenitus]|uniref:Pentatricopeptide repeat-containing protein-mitochondrial domain-containing protein n=1 Tax=Dacryopinax primogenitus (strain DJM 731) TaxID=1858805 RepID=M5G826_DACPD|nr:uncharacterized protein DACRYDRAFT_48637 [Dacryopinax primogenitus]EJU04290.1 hypothetical protein DACRYDRAFT_48637 [Dacryopinax primogenitus]
MYAIFTDMAAAGVQPDLETYNLLLHSARYNDLNCTFILRQMTSAGIERNALSYQHLIQYHADNRNLEMCLQIVDEMSVQEIHPTIATVEAFINLAAQLNYARLALDFALNYEEKSARRIPATSWMKMLGSCAVLHYIEGVEICWVKGVEQGLAPPDEGLCLDVLHVAGRSGRPELAMGVIRALRKNGAVFREHHLAPVLEAFLNANNLKDALHVLSLMRSHSISPEESTTMPILRRIVQSVDDVDNAFYILEELKNDGKPIDISAVNVIIRASVELDDLQRAVGTYKECEKLGVQPTRDTFYYLLDACVKAQHHALGEKLYEEMTRAGILPDEAAYEKMLLLALTQTSYEEAFYYLEEMKLKSPDVPARVYEAIIRKCVTSFDPRWKVAAEEMQQRGYSLSSKLLRFIEKGEDDPVTSPRF